MLNLIKSFLIIKKIFSNLDEELKLTLIIYNKHFQKILNIDIIDYKRFSGKYIIGERNGFGKEYNGSDKKLLYEGEYLNSIRNGKGKEYYNGKLLYEGEFLNGRRSGKGKEYYPNYEILLYEGEFLRGKRNGKNFFDN